MKIALISAAVAAMAFTAVPAEASGSGSGSRGGIGGYGGGGASASRISEEARLVRRGRSQVRRRITCSKCEYHDRLDNSTAAEVAQAVRSGRFELRDDDRVAVLYYLRDRYGV